MPGLKNSDDVGVRKTPPNQLRETLASTMSYDSEHASSHSKTKSDRDINIQMYKKKEIPMKYRLWTTIPGFPKDERQESIETHLKACPVYCSTL